jgi:hypothetical protein
MSRKWRQPRQREAGNPSGQAEYVISGHFVEFASTEELIAFVLQVLQDEEVSDHT